MESECAVSDVSWRSVLSGWDFHHEQRSFPRRIFLRSRSGWCSLRVFTFSMLKLTPASGQDHRRDNLWCGCCSPTPAESAYRSCAPISAVAYGSSDSAFR